MVIHHDVEKSLQLVRPGGSVIDRGIDQPVEVVEALCDLSGVTFQVETMSESQEVPGEIDQLGSKPSAVDLGARPCRHHQRSKVAHLEWSLGG
jgi:hypothetical protein